MPQYRVLQKSFVNNRIVEEGEVVDYDGDPGPNLESVKKGKKAEPAAADQAGAGESLA